MKTGVVALALAACLVGLTAQEPSNSPAFEVVSIRPSPRNPASAFDRFSRADSSPGRFTATRIAVRSLIEFAYDVPDYLLEGGPAWAGSDLYDIMATVPDGATLDDRRAMLRTLLADRFALVVREETRESPVYELVMAHEDGRFGPRLSRPDGSAVDCEQVEAERRANAAERFRERRASLLPEGPVCGNLSSSRPTPDGGNQAAWSAGRQSIAALTRYLAPQVRRPVIDRTGLTGEFDFRLEYIEPWLGTPAQDDTDWPTPVDVPTLFAALKEQLGLALEPATAPVDLVVIDHVERPSPN